MVPTGEQDGGGGINQESVRNRYTLLYVKWINKNLLYSTENHIQYLVIIYNGKEFEKYIYIQIKEYIYISISL